MFFVKKYFKNIGICHPCISLSNLLDSLPMLSVQNMFLILKFWNLTKLKHSVIKSGHNVPSYSQNYKKFREAPR